MQSSNPTHTAIQEKCPHHQLIALTFSPIDLETSPHIHFAAIYWNEFPRRGSPNEMHQNYSCEMTIEGPIAAVYDALTTTAGCRGWWTHTCEVGNRIGATSTFHFGESYHVVRIEEMKRESEVHWRCLSHYHHAPQALAKTDEWVGTVLKFHLTAQTPGRTAFRFEHLGLNEKLECYQTCEQTWNHFLKQSLKNYVEIGRGEPFGILVKQ